ncbi:MAG: hypothetical protein A2144_10225 [Chloroflexi bacterium RBG_16_50_9]|nr:MAG: hypothetical protein A2144_10225 [Chloroflexi bacterium RBG_16_50_9]
MNSLSNRKYWLKWTIACGAGEFLGIAVAAGIWVLHATILGEPQVISQKIILLVFMIFAGVFEGLVTGGLQWSVLKIKFTDLKAKNWLFFTALGAAVAWLLGMMPSTFFIPDAAGNHSVGFELSGWLFIFMSAFMGMVLGVIFGIFQWLELRKHALAAGQWILANSVGWLAGIVTIFLGASLPSADTKLAVTIVIGAVSGLLGGLFVGAITGLFLIKLQDKPVT